jgi:peptidoglycan/LPS O-acetylase OafA/YrhL
MLHRRWLILGLFISSLSLSVCFETERWRLGGKLLGVLLGSPQLWARLLPLYLAGVVFYLFRERIPRLPWMAAAAVIVLVLAARLPLGCTALFPVAGTYLILYLAYAPWLRLQRFGRYGDFSYGTYLYAFPVQQTLMRGFGHPVAPWHLFLCATPPTLALAAASWYGVERRFLQPARRKETLLHAMEQAPEEST